MSRRAFLRIAGILCAFPLVAQAASLTPGQVSAVLSLLHAFGAGGVSTCLLTPIAENLAVGSTGSAVTSLQQFLDISPTTGYFGALTKQAVMNWQSQDGIPATGYVGPLTRATIVRHCGGQSGNLSASPTLGAAPLTVSFSANDISAGPQYIINYGDGNNSGPLSPVLPSCAASATNCSPSLNSAHTYSAAGTYTAILEPYISCMRSNPRCMIATIPLGRVTITVTGQNSGSISITGIDAPASLNVGQTGAWAVHASVPNQPGTTIQYSVNWGDQAAYPLAATASLQSSASFTHSYAATGTYTPTFTVYSNGRSANASAAVAVSAQTHDAGRNPNKQVLAVWYGWWGTPAVSGSWMHWGPAKGGTDNPQNHTDSATRYYPQNGPYDSHNILYMQSQINLAKASGITGFIASWWGPGNFMDTSLQDLFTQADQSDFEVTPYFDGFTDPGGTTVQSTAQDILYLLNHYANHTSWLTWSGKPVIFVYGARMYQLTTVQWSQVVRTVDASYPKGVALIADGDSAPAGFAGSDHYNITSSTQGMTPTQAGAWVSQEALNTIQQQLVQPSQVVTTATIIPGYDDSELSYRPPPRPITARDNGEMYRALWSAASKANPDWILITSWNEWHEGSQIEPSYEFGNLYTQITGQYAPQFLSQPDAANPYTSTGYSFNAGITLEQHQSISYGAFTLSMQSDNNLVLYQNGSTPVWASNTAGQRCGGECFAVFQGDGNLVVFDGSGKPLWATNTAQDEIGGKLATHLVLSSQKPYVELTDANGAVLWSAN